ncbi:MAG: Recombinase [Deltaproteobacteria bacterium]|nr:Recombinase [Deltaproteobacteria bacterium]
MSYARIAVHLNALGIPTRSGKRWAPGTVYGILNRS